jgi:heme-degrading monooxygenase HmoA
MFTRVVRMTCKPGQRKQACTHINNVGVPVLRKQPGFVDHVLLVSTTDPNQVVALSFWNAREDAERFHHDQYSRLLAMMKDMLTGTPTIETYDVDSFTTHDVVSGKVA